MGKDAAHEAELRTIIDAALRGGLAERQTDRANELGCEATNSVMLAASAHIREQGRRLAEISAAGTPSS